MLHLLNRVANRSVRQRAMIREICHINSVDTITQANKMLVFDIAETLTPLSYEINHANFESASYICPARQVFDFCTFLFKMKDFCLITMLRL